MDLLSLIVLERISELGNGRMIAPLPTTPMIQLVAVQQLAKDLIRQIRLRFSARFLHQLPDQESEELRLARRGTARPAWRCVR